MVLVVEFWREIYPFMGIGWLLSGYLVGKRLYTLRCIRIWDKCPKERKNMVKSDPETRSMKCPTCDGHGSVFVWSDGPQEDCGGCKSTGKIVAGTLKGTNYEWMINDEKRNPVPVRED